MCSKCMLDRLSVSDLKSMGKSPQVNVTGNFPCPGFKTFNSNAFAYQIHYMSSSHNMVGL
jgi:hypothetical protein